jgi:hypothetical protein
VDAAGEWLAQKPNNRGFRIKTAREPDTSIDTKKSPSRRTLLGLDWLNFLLADVQTGVGPFLAIYLAGYEWNEESVGLALTVGGIAGILTQTPAGGLVDAVRSKRGWLAQQWPRCAGGNPAPNLNDLDGPSSNS